LTKRKNCCLLDINHSLLAALLNWLSYCLIIIL